MIGIKRYLTAELVLQDIDNLDDAQIVSVDDTEALYRVNKAMGTIEPITSPTLGIVPTGSIIPYLGTNVPEGYLPCTGAEYDITQYPKLYSVLQSNKLPDLRGLFLMGSGVSERPEIVAQPDSIDLGEFKDYQIGRHTHSLVTGITNWSYGYNVASGNTTGEVNSKLSPSRPRAFGVNFIVRAI